MDTGRHRKPNHGTSHQVITQSVHHELCSLTLTKSCVWVGAVVILPRWTQSIWDWAWIVPRVQWSCASRWLRPLCHPQMTTKRNHCSCLSLSAYTYDHLEHSLWSIDGEGKCMGFIRGWVGSVCGHELKMDFYCIAASLRDGPESQ